MKTRQSKIKDILAEAPDLDTPEVLATLSDRDLDDIYFLTVIQPVLDMITPEDMRG